jgi:hypothetical protein
MYAVCRGQGVTDAGQQQYQGPPPVKQLMDQAAKQWQVMGQTLAVPGAHDPNVVFLWLAACSGTSPACVTCISSLSEAAKQWQGIV